MTTNSLYLILCVAASLTLLAFTQKNIDGTLAENSSTSNKSLMRDQPTMTTGNSGTTGDAGTNTTGGSTNPTTGHTTGTTMSTSSDYPVRPVVTHTEIGQPGVTSTSGSTTTMDVPVTTGYSTPN